MQDKKTFDFLRRLVFEMLLATDGRTTDMLETLLNEKMRVSVLRQELAGGDHIRESILVSGSTNLVVSQNIALVHSGNVPPALFEKIAGKQEGIGKSISALGLESFREVAASGFIPKADVVDLFQKPVSLRFFDCGSLIPYKKYFIYFGLLPGIQMLEYFNPELVNHRLRQAINNDGGRNNEE
ncbi:4-hydroxybenzoate synthetase [Paenibacillus sp. HB172176]|uniref:4-hydroxybenzoate synthetase n=1 Tax=Paenibacillus sp. HB172176 TaxID=2493690 RepID=UPI001439440D|nr:4-hydroxybenzoate synthetase [Paenibacillus sp. HB172176]